MNYINTVPTHGAAMGTIGRTYQAAVTCRPPRRTSPELSRSELRRFIIETLG